MNFESFLKDRDFAKSMTSEEYYNLPRNPLLDKKKNILCRVFFMDRRE